MGFFSKNPNEVNYPGGKKHFTDVIKNSSPCRTLIWQNPEEDFNTNSTLIVAESEEALFFKNGVIEEIFSGGRYKLSTHNYPFLSRLVNAFSGGISSFNCKVYFVNKAHTMEVLWGTDTPIQMRDPVQGIATSIQARGAYRVQIDDSRKFLLKMVGNLTHAMTEDELKLFFRSEFSQYIKSAVANKIKNSGEEILGICAAQDELAAQLTQQVGEAFYEYGIHLVNFSIAALDIPMDDPGRAKLEAAFVERRQQQILGYSWQQKQSAQIMHEMARNQGDSGMTAAGAGLGMGMAAAGMFGNLAQQMFQPMNQMNAGAMNPGMSQTNAGAMHPGMNQPNAGAMHPGMSQPNAGAMHPGMSQTNAGAMNPGMNQPDAAKRCAVCGAENTPAAKFCAACGQKLPEEHAEPAAPKKSFCPNCGQEITAGMNFCSGCGMKL